MKIFIAGSKGQLGHDCLAVLGPCYDVVGMDLPELDITARASVAAALDPFRPDLIVNCAAYTQVDAAETERDAAQRVNVEGPRLLAEHAQRRGAHLVHISTDYVFDGRREPPRPYVETDATGPACVYGETKLAGEQAVQAATRRWAILRTAWLYGSHGHNFLKTILRLARRDPARPLRVVNDQYGSPTWSYRLALQIARLVEARNCGLYHATAEGHCTWYELARRFLAHMGVQHALVPCTTEEYPTAARRPRNSILENARLKAEGLNVMQPWEQDVAEFVRRHGEQLRREAEGP
jgi:dTDP-4-dehydrorhamnose reductase